MTMVTLTEARKKLYRLLAELNESHEPLHIKSKRGNAVLVSEDDWRSIQETLYLLSMPPMRNSIAKGLRTPVEKCSKDLRW